MHTFNVTFHNGTEYEKTTVEWPGDAFGLFRFLANNPAISKVNPLKKLSVEEVPSE